MRACDQLLRAPAEEDGKSSNPDQEEDFSLQLDDPNEANELVITIPLRRLGPQEGGNPPESTIHNFTPDIGYIQVANRRYREGPLKLIE